MRALSPTGFFVVVALPLLAVSVVLAVIAFRVGGGEEEGAGVAVVATPSPPAAAASTPAGTPAPTPTAPPATPAPTAPPRAAPTPTATPPPTAEPPAVAGVPYSLSDLAGSLAPAGVTPTDLYDPRSACAGTAVEGVPFVVSGDEESGRFAVWVLFVYPDSEARRADWETDQRAVPLVAGCEPPNGFVYWNANLLLWFVGFYGEDVAPGSPPVSREEVREHPAIRAFLTLPR